MTKKISDLSFPQKAMEGVCLAVLAGMILGFLISAVRFTVGQGRK